VIVKLEVMVGAPIRGVGRQEEVSPNARVHWTRRASSTKRMRTEAKVAVLSAWTEAFRRGQVPTLRPTALSFVVVSALYKVPRPNHQRDKTNLSAALKPAIDGIVDAGVMANDRDLQPPLVDICKGPGVVLLTITGRLDEAAA
jgi:hypothetical protein